MNVNLTIILARSLQEIKVTSNLVPGIKVLQFKPLTCNTATRNVVHSELPPFLIVVRAVAIIFIFVD